MEEVKNVVANENFDWNAFENDLGVYDQPKEQITEAYDKTLSNVAVGEVVEGTVTAITKREVLVNIGYKSEGVIPVSEFRYNPDLKVGDKIEVYVESAEDKNGQLALSHKKARQLKSWDRVNEALEKDEIIKGYIKCRTKGGMIVDVFGIEAFLPGSQIDVKPIRDYDIYVDKTMEFKVVKINQEFRNVVVSHKALIEAELEAQKQVIMSKLEKGQILEGTVKNITSYGVFVDLGGVDGLIHITDLSWGRVNHPEEIVSLDQKINVVILDFDDQKKRIALGLKQLTPHPWEALDPNLKVGDKVTVEVLDVDLQRERISLGLKQTTEDPWIKLVEVYPVDTIVDGRVTKIVPFGAFIELGDNVEGLVHISEMAMKHIDSPNQVVSVGDEVKVKVMDVNTDRRRISLSMKAAAEDLGIEIDVDEPEPKEEAEDAE